MSAANRKGHTMIPRDLLTAFATALACLSWGVALWLWSV